MDPGGLRKRVRTTVGNRATDLTQACVLNPRRRRPEDPQNRFSRYYAGLAWSWRSIDAFLALSVAERRPHTFPEASGVHFGTNFGFKNGHFSYFFGGPVGALLTPVFRRIFSTQAL